MTEDIGLTKDQETVLRATLQALRTIRYGAIQLIVQDGRVVQIEKMEKIRLPQKIPCT
ncbi:MAG: DUF2292 domain-containing protein [Chloroflexota bacterium]|nr:MAG: DUF2292 domain-containing protein [Chloroflexota bacterium]